MKKLLLAFVATFAFGSAFAQSPESQPVEQAAPPVVEQPAVDPVTGQPVVQPVIGVPVAKTSAVVSPGVIAAAAGGLIIVAVAAGGGSSKKDKPSSP